MDYSKKSKYKVIKEGESPEENDILVSLQSLVDRWDENEMSPACEYKDELQNLINDYLQRPLHEVEGRTSHTYNHDTRKMVPDVEVMDNNVFYKLVNHIANYTSLGQLQIIQEEGIENYSELLQIIKLFGIPYVENHADGLVSKALLAAIDNYEKIKEGTITGYSDLELRPLKEFKVYLDEQWTEHKWYSWTVKIKGYSSADVKREIYENEDGDFDYWEHDHMPDFHEEIGDNDREGLEISKIEEVGIAGESSQNLNEQANQIQQQSDNIPVTKTVSAIMKHILKEYGKQEIKEMLEEPVHDVFVTLAPILKLYSWTDASLAKTHGAKQLIQFMWDKNLPDDYTQFIGEKLPPVHRYVLQQSYLEWDKTAKEVSIQIYDTNWETAKCEATNHFWDYDYDIYDSEILDSDYIGEEEWSKVEVDGTRVWDVNKSDNSYYNPEGGCEV